MDDDKLEKLVNIFLIIMMSGLVIMVAALTVYMVMSIFGLLR